MGREWFGLRNDGLGTIRQTIPNNKNNQISKKHEVKYIFKKLK